MNSIFADLIAQSKVAIYMDNILIYTADLDHHHIIVQEVLGRLWEYDLYLKPSKCTCKQQEIEYLCHDPDPYPDYLGLSSDADYPFYFFKD